MRIFEISRFPGGARELPLHLCIIRIVETTARRELFATANVGSDHKNENGKPSITTLHKCCQVPSSEEVTTLPVSSAAAVDAVAVLLPLLNELRVSDTLHF